VEHEVVAKTSMDAETRRSPTDFLAGGGRMGALMRSHDWSGSPLGDPATWPDMLKAAVATCLSSRFPMVIWWGPELVMLYNDAWQPILGDTKHPAGLGRPGADSWPETWPIVGAQFESALGGVASWSEDLLLASDRHGFIEECYFTYSHSPLRDAAGRVVGVMSAVSETTARVLVERRLRVLRELSNAALEAAGEAKSLQQVAPALLGLLCAGNPDVSFAVLYVTGPDERARRSAAAAVDATLFPPAVAPLDADAWGIAEALRSRAAVEIEAAPQVSALLPGGAWPEPTRQVVALPLSGSRLERELCGVLLVGANSRLRLDASYRDFLGLVAAQLGGAITALQLREAERAARADAERAGRVKDEFLATLSHELRTPLHAVIGWAQILRADVSDAEQVSAAVEVIERNAQHQARLIGDLLDISRITSGSMRIERQPVALPAVIAAAIESVTPDADAKGVRIEPALEAIPLPVLGDAARIQQVMWNLLVNAIKFTPAGGRIEVALAAAERHAEIRVRDDGAGIDPAFLPEIFDRFRQADGSVSRAHGGLGLGLTLVKQLVELHGGRVRAESAGAGRGATFTLELPLAADTQSALTADAQSARAPVAQSAREPEAAAPSRSGGNFLDGVRVLVIDDDPDSLTMLRRLVEDGAGEVRTAASAEVALQLAARESFDVIVSDIGMPERDGYAFIRALRARGDATPALALTAFAHADDRLAALSAGYQSHLPKPVDTGELLVVVSRLAGARSGVAPQASK
jgi:signal transduction histidine kinase/ActR/RegA family two-component response regulator